MSSDNCINLQGSSAPRHLFNVHIALGQLSPSQHGQKAQWPVGASRIMEGLRKTSGYQMGKAWHWGWGRWWRTGVPAPMESVDAVGIPVPVSRDIVCDTYKTVYHIFIWTWVCVLLTAYLQGRKSSLTLFTMSRIKTIKQKDTIWFKMLQQLGKHRWN